jgi:hypothetical protein
MGIKIIKTTGTLATVFIFLVAMVVSVTAQGRGHGGGGGRPSGAGQPSGVGVDRGLGQSSDASMGRADEGRNMASDRSNGRSDAGLDRARLASDNMNNANRDLAKHPGIANTLHTSANSLRAGYQTALLTNPNLTFGQFVAATRLGQNLGANHPNITRDAILAGLADGKSIGQTLRNLGLSSDQANAAKKQAEREIDQSRKQ